MPVICLGGSKIKKPVADLYMNAYTDFLNKVKSGNVVAAINVTQQPKYLMASRTVIEDILKDENCGGVGIALALVPKNGELQFSLVLAPLKQNADKTCEIDFKAIQIYEDLGQGGLYNPTSADLNDKFQKFLESF